jgi:DNA-binding response OmpR family regulator
MNKNSILLVEDDALTGALLTTLFNRSNYAVTWLQDGKTALDHFQKASPSAVVLLDILLPFVNGWTLLEHLQSNAAWASSKIVVLSAKDHREDQARAMHLGAQAYQVKPFDPDALLALVTHLLPPQAGV